MRSRYAVLLSMLLAMAGGGARAGDSLLRISCEGADVGAEILVNGKFRGECPIDIKVGAGTLKVRVFKPIDKLRERSFEVELRMAEDSVKRIEAVLEDRFTPAGQIQEDQRLRAEQAEAQRKEAARQAEAAERQRLRQAEQAAAEQRAAEQRRAEESQVQLLTSRAEAGDGDAQMQLSERFQAGQGVPRDAGKGAEWFKRAAASGNELALFLTNAASKSNPPEDVEAIKRMLRLPKEGLRVLGVNGHENVKALINSDPFFAMPPGGPAASFSYFIGPMNMNTAGTCQRNGRLAGINGANTVGEVRSPVEGTAVLGGLTYLEAVVNSGAFRNTRSEISAIASVYGSPFPLTVGKRFGFTVTQASSGTYGGKPTEIATSCMVTDVRISTNGRAPAGAPQLICVSQLASYMPVTRWAFDENSGCMMGLRGFAF